MKRMLRFLPPSLLAAAVFLVACEAPTSSLNDGESAGFEIGTTADFDEVLAHELDLSDDQRRSVQDAMRRHHAPDVNPGSLWFIAARLHQSLDDAQKARLFRYAEQERLKHLPKLVGVYGPCSPVRPSDVQQPSQIPIGLLADLFTEEQMARALEIRRRYAERLQGLQEQLHSGAITREEYREAVAALYEAMEAAIFALLTDEQIAMLERRLAAQGSDAQATPGRRAMIESLGLDRRQVAALDELHEKQCTILTQLFRQAHAEGWSREELLRSIHRLVEAKWTAYPGILDRRQYEIAEIHDALLVIHVRRFLQHLGGAGSGRG